MYTNRVFKISYKKLCLTDSGFAGKILKKYGLFRNNCLSGLLLVFKKDNIKGRNASTAVYRNIIINTFVFRLYNSFLPGGSIRQIFPRERQVWKIESTGGNQNYSAYKSAKILSLNFKGNIKPETFFSPESRRIFSSTHAKREPLIGGNKILLIRGASGSNFIFRINGGQPDGMPRIKTIGDKVRFQLNSKLFDTKKFLNNEFKNYTAVNYPSKHETHLRKNNYEVPKQSPVQSYYNFYSPRQRYLNELKYKNRLSVYEINGGQPDGMLRIKTIGGKVPVTAAGAERTQDLYTIATTGSLSIFVRGLPKTDIYARDKVRFQLNSKLFGIKKFLNNEFKNYTAVNYPAKNEAHLRKNNYEVPKQSYYNFYSPRHRYLNELKYKNRLSVYEINGGQTDGMPGVVSRGLPEFNIYTRNKELLQLNSEISGTIKILNKEFKNYMAVSYLAKRKTKLYKVNHEMPEQPYYNLNSPRQQYLYLKESMYKNRRREYYRHYEQERVSETTAFGTIGAELFFERILMKTRRQELINKIRNLNYKINENITYRQVRHPGVKFSYWTGGNTGRFNDIQKFFRDKNSFGTDIKPLMNLRPVMNLNKIRNPQFIGDVKSVLGLLPITYAKPVGNVQPRENSALTKDTFFVSAKIQRSNEMPLINAGFGKQRLGGPEMTETVDSLNYTVRHRSIFPQNTVKPVTVPENGTREKESKLRYFRLKNQKWLKEKTLLKQERFLKPVKSNDLIHGRLIRMISENPVYGAKFLSTRAEIAGAGLSGQNESGNKLGQEEKRYSGSETAIQLISKMKSISRLNMRSRGIPVEKGIRGKPPAYLYKDNTPENIPAPGGNRILTAGNNMRFNPGDYSKTGIGWKEPEIRNLHRTLPNIETENPAQTRFSDYPQMDFHHTKESDYEHEAVKPKSETTVQKQLYRNEEGFKVGKADMEKLVDNVCSEIEKRLDFERQRRGL